MTLLVNHPQRSEIRERLQQNIVLRRLEPRAFDELETSLAVMDYRKGDVLLSQGAHDMEQYFVRTYGPLVTPLSVIFTVFRSPAKPTSLEVVE